MSSRPETSSDFKCTMVVPSPENPRNFLGENRRADERGVYERRNIAGADLILRLTPVGPWVVLCHSSDDQGIAVNAVFTI